MTILLFKKFYKMRSIGEGTLHANLRYGLRGGDEQQSRVHQPLADKPTMGRHNKVTLELLFERGERTMGERRKLLNRDVVEDISIDHLLKTTVLRIDITQHLTAQATLIHRHNGVNKLRHLQVVSRSILQLAILV